MSSDDCQRILLDVLRDVQKISGRQWNGLKAGAKPIGELQGFDSLSGVEATVMLEEKFGCEFSVDSVFVSDNGKHALTVCEISDRLNKLVAAKEKEK